MTKFSAGDVIVRDGGPTKALVVGVVREKNAEYDRYNLQFLPHGVSYQPFLVRHIEKVWQLEESVIQ